MTRSETLPSNTCPKPVRPWVAQNDEVGTLLLDELDDHVVSLAGQRLAFDFESLLSKLRCGAFDEVDAGSRRHESQSAGHDIDCYNTLDI
jgi:hypothetical protein